MKQIFVSKFSGYWILLFFFIIIICHHFFANIGFYGYDDIQYCKISKQLIHGIYDWNNHYSYRLVPIILTSLSFLCFGISDFSASLPSLLITFLILYLIYSNIKTYGNEVIFLCFTFLISTGWFLFYTDKPMPDIYVAFSILLTVTILRFYRFSQKPKSALLYALYTSIALFIGFLSKETILFILPVLLYFFIYDIVKKQYYSFWLYLLVFGLLIVILYFTISWMYTNNPFIRFYAVLNNSYPNDCNYYVQSNSVIFKRISIDFFRMLVENSMIFSVLLLLPFLIAKFRTIFSILTVEHFFICISFLLILSSNFMTIYPNHYSPMCIDPRHYLFVIPISVIPASYYFSNNVNNKKYLHFILVVLLVIASYSVYQIQTNSWILYLSFVILFSLYLNVPNNQLFRKIFLIGIILICLIKPISLIYNANNIKYNRQKEVWHNYFSSKLSSNLIVLTDDIQKNISEFYMEFEHKNIRFIDFVHIDTSYLQNKKLIFYYNPYTYSLTKNKEFSIQKFCKTYNYSYNIEYKDQETGIIMYSIFLQ